MLHSFPAFYETFRCLAGDCPDNCCVGWEVVVDDDTARRYAALGTPLGRALTAAMERDADGDRVIRMQDGHCPFWTEQHLCQVELELGRDGPCATCRKFPRLTQDYGILVEYGLALSCPEAARLIFSQQGPWELIQRGELGRREDAEVDVQDMALLLQRRKHLLALLWEDSVPGRQALRNCLAAGARWESCGEAQQAADPEKTWRKLLEVHRDMEILTEQWGEMLEKAQKVPELAIMEDTDARNLGTYYLYRNWLQALADLDSVGKLQRLAAAWIVGSRLIGLGYPRLRVYQLYSKEVEHDDDNVQLLEDALLDEPALSLDCLISLV